MHPMPRTLDPLAGVTRLLVDGTNLLHALGRADGPLPPAAVVGRLRALVPAGVQATVVLDGTPAPGAIDRRLTAGIEVRYAGRRPADALLVDLAGMDPTTTLVVTDDNELATSLRRFGARTVRTGWMADRLARQRLETPAAGRPRPPANAPAETTGDEGPPRPGWRPGRGATRKTGNPKRGHPAG
jgi:ribosomal protein S21